VNRRGLSLLEVLIALTLTGVVALLAWSILQAAAFRLRDRSERFSMEHSLRVASSAARALLEPLGQDTTAGSDLALPAADAFVARAVRGSGILCSAGPDSLWVRSGSDWWSELRAPSAGRDSLMVATVLGPERWSATVLDAGPLSGTCPDGSPAMLLPARLAPADLAAIGPGSPVRVFEPMELRVYSSSGATWLGMRSVSSGGSIQPLAGPLSGAGVRFSYYSRAGTIVTAPGLVAWAGIAISGLTERAGGVGIARLSRASIDSVSGAVLLRNAP
jgi:prepilin-type N-terminal cleavage/methylation domain-containing protein